MGDVFGFGAQWGYQTDPETGLLLLTSRYYDPGLARFLMRDPLGPAGGVNLYRYVGNSPANAADPLGLCDEDDDGIGDLQAGFRSFWAGVRKIGDVLHGLTEFAASFNPFTSAGIALNKVGEHQYGQAVLFALPAAGELTKALPVGELWTAGNFRARLVQLTGENPLLSQAHHVLPQKFAEEFGALGFDIHDARFGSWWPTLDHLRNAYAYNQEWETFLTTNPTSEEAVAFARQLAAQYGFKVHF